MLTHFGRAVNIQRSLFNVLAGNRGKWETPQAKPRRLPSLPEESKFPQRKSTVYNQKQQSMRKQPIFKRN
jgi:hypothetical protein